MDTSRFETHKNVFNVLDVWVYFDFKTDTSIGFRLERYSKSLCPCRQLGWLTIHHPCSQHIKTKIFANIPTEYLAVDKINTIIIAAFRELGIPEDETFEVVASYSASFLEVENREDRDGLVDCLVTYARPDT